jgi:murein L,D-transpeptidase YcbB/YkuD
MSVSNYLKLATIGLLFFVLAIYRDKFITIAYVKTESKIPAAIPGTQQLSAEAEALLRKFLDAAEMPDLHLTNFAGYQKEAKEFYSVVGDTLPWIDQGEPTSQARAIIRSLRDAGFKGLQPEDYDAPEWEKRLAKFERGPSMPEPELVKFDLAVTISTMRYISDLHLGRANPRTFHAQLDIEESPLDLSEFVRQKLIGATDVSAVLGSVEPPFPIYRRTEDALRKYIELAKIDDGAQLSVPSQAIKPKDSYPEVTDLAKLLVLQEDLSPEQAKASSIEKYEGPIVEGVKHFQMRHGLESNGVLNAATVKKLNTPSSQRITQLQLAMERMRWLPHRFQEPPVIVNIPEFRLYALNDQYRSIFTMKVVVGRAYGHQTPIFASQIKSVIFRPYWNVPESIVKAELIPHLKKNPSYFSQNDYEIVDRHENVVSEEADNKEVIAQLIAGKVRVRQMPGPQNALGLLKFEFPNQYDVYMHGTPAKALFARTRRDFSHGCIRLEDPVELAKWILQDRPEWSEENMRAAMNGDTRVEVKLKEPIPVLIFYSTAVVLDGGEAHFYDDIYGLDAELEQILAQRKSGASSAEMPNER